MIVDPHNRNVEKICKDSLRSEVSPIEFEIFIYPDAAYATGLKAERDGDDWNPTVHHLKRLEIYTVDHLKQSGTN